jgi:hypothetical protein
LRRFRLPVAPPARCPLSGGPPRVWPYAPRRVVPDAFVLRQLVRRGCLCPLTRPSLVAKPTRRIESAFVGVYGRLKIFEFRVVGLFTQPAANENPYPMKGLLAFADPVPTVKQTGFVRRVNWSSRLALQTFETAEPPRLCGRFSPVVTCFSLHKPNARRHIRWHASWVGSGRTTPPPTRDPPWTRTRTWSPTAATETEGSRSTTRLATPSDACTRTQRWCRTAWTPILSL